MRQTCEPCHFLILSLCVSVAMKALLECGLTAHFLLLAGDDHFSMINRLSEENYFLTKVPSMYDFACVSVCACMCLK